jgi:hypothetical protein
MNHKPQIVDFWGTELLFRAHQQDVQPLAIPERSKAYLIEVGVPIKLDAASQALGINLGPSDAVHYLAPVVQGRSEGSAHHCRLLGHSFEARICLREPDGVVVLIEDDGTATFLNSSIEQFVAFLCVYEKSTGQGAGLTRNDFAGLVSQLMNEYRSIDPAVFQDPNSWWAVVLEDMRY